MIPVRIMIGTKITCSHTNDECWKVKAEMFGGIELRRISNIRHLLSALYASRGSRFSLQLIPLQMFHSVDAMYTVILFCNLMLPYCEGVQERVIFIYDLCKCVLVRLRETKMMVTLDICTVNTFENSALCCWYRHTVALNDGNDDDVFNDDEGERSKVHTLKIALSVWHNRTRC